MTLLAHCLFCDDIRFETSGQVTIVGAYIDGTVLIGDAILNLNAVLTVLGRVDDVYDFEIVGARDDVELFRTAPPGDVISNNIESAKMDGIDVVSLTAPLPFPPMVVEKPSDLTVSLVFGNESLIVGRMRFEPPRQKKAGKKAKKAISS